MNSSESNGSARRESRMGRRFRGKTDIRLSVAIMGRDSLASSASQSLDDCGYRIPIARRTGDTEEFLHLAEITDCLHLPFVKTEQESTSAVGDSQDPFAVRRKFPWRSEERCVGRECRW